MEMKILEEKIKSYIQKSKTKRPINSSDKQRIKSANFTKILKNKIFKGYEKIKFVQDKNFNIRKFLKSKPEDKYLLSDEKYNIYYDNKYLNKYKPLTENEYFLVKNLSIKSNSQSKQIENHKSKSTKDLFITENKKLKIKKKLRSKRQKLYDINENKSNINDSSKIFNSYNENDIYSKYPFIYLEKIEDNIIHPKDMRNYPHYISKYKDKNRNQEYFLYNLSHPKDKKVKNIYRSLTPRIPINKSKVKLNNYKKEIENYYLMSFSPSKIKEKYINKNFCINSFDNNKIRKTVYENLFKIPLENSQHSIKNENLKI